MLALIGSPLFGSSFLGPFSLHVGCYCGAIRGTIGLGVWSSCRVIKTGRLYPSKWGRLNALCCRGDGTGGGGVGIHPMKF